MRPTGHTLTDYFAFSQCLFYCSTSSFKELSLKTTNSWVGRNVASLSGHSFGICEYICFALTFNCLKHAVSS